MSEQDQDQKTEQATPHRMQKAMKDGQVAFSAELAGGIILMCGVMFFWLASYWFFGEIGGVIRNRASSFSEMINSPLSIPTVITSDVGRVGFACLALILPLFIISLLGGALQTGFNLSAKPLDLKWDKLSVPAGFKRIFSSSSAMRGALSVAKTIVIVAIIYLIARSKLEEVATSGGATFQDLMFVMCGILLYVAIAIAATLTLVGIVDFGFQKWKHLQDLKMSIRDIRDEHKENEGDPLIKARVRRLQAEMGKKRALSQVPEASVIITNPTHFAVAVKYERDDMEAPVVLAKGADFLARKIIELAKENGVPVVERKPVARFLYFNVKVGNAIPYELYQAVAEILSYVERTRRAA